MALFLISILRFSYKQSNTATEERVAADTEPNMVGATTEAGPTTVVATREPTAAAV